VVFEDEHIVVINKPTGVLSVTTNGDHPNLAQSVFDAFGCESGRVDKMVVHRLGMDTSGVMLFAKTTQALRSMNELFRSRSIERQYEALVCGHIQNDKGMLDLPLMRDYVFPPFVRVSTDEHQAKLASVDAEDGLDKKYLQLPKESLTKYSVISREELDGQPVTRVILTSISGRTHQLNVHLAAFGHPIVGDTIYGVNGWAALNGGLTDSELDALIPNSSRASLDLQKAIASAAKAPCVHAKSLQFRHPVTGAPMNLSVDAPF
jgi:tRNA pseudouridine32 synthase/23S rRNA pseudouridine746 synthase